MGYRPPFTPFTAEHAQALPRFTLAEEDVHGAEDYDNSEQKVQREVVAKECSRNESSEYRCNSGAILLQQSVRIPANG